MSDQRGIVDGRYPCQADWRDGRKIGQAGTIDVDEAHEVYEAYAARYGRAQSFERIAERAGFGRAEAEMLIGRKLRTWRPA